MDTFTALIILLGAIVCGFLAATVANAKDLNGYSWFWIGFLCGPLGLLAACGMPDRSRFRPAQAANHDGDTDQSAYYKALARHEAKLLALTTALFAFAAGVRASETSTVVTNRAGDIIGLRVISSTANGVTNMTTFPASHPRVAALIDAREREARRSAPVELAAVWPPARPTLALSVTNSLGDVFTNLALVRVVADGLLLEHKAGQIKVKLADLPDDLREKYEPQAAAARQKEISDSRDTTAFLARTERLQREDAQQKARVTEQWRQEREGRMARRTFGDPVYIKGKVIQVTKDGLLIASEGGHTGEQREIVKSIHNPQREKVTIGGVPVFKGNCMLKHLPGQSSIVDGDCVETQAYDAGVYNYQTVLGSGATVRLFDYDYPQSN